MGPRFRSRPYKLYILIMLIVTYLINQLDRYMLGIVTKPMAQEIQYGDMGCMKKAQPSDPTAACNATTKDSLVENFLNLFKSNTD